MSAHETDVSFTHAFVSTTHAFHFVNRCHLLIQHLCSQFRQDAPFGSRLRHIGEQTTVAIVLVDMRVAGLPITWVNSAFEKLTGYRKVDAVGRNCRFLQGKATEPAAVRQLVKRIRDPSDSLDVIAITNYDKQGQPFRNLVSMHAIRSVSDQIARVHTSTFVKDVCTCMLALTRACIQPDLQDQSASTITCALACICAPARANARAHKRSRAHAHVRDCARLQACARTRAKSDESCAHERACAC
eukprot:4065208-Pleurochrysis_carterae.AAC.2